MNSSRVPIIILYLTLVFLVGPFLVVFIAAFGGEPTLKFPPTSFSTQWFTKVFEVESFRSSFLTSLGLGLMSTSLALALGIPVAYALSRFRLPGAVVIQTVLTSPALVPGLVVGLALLQYFINLGGSVYPSLLAAHTALLLPYVVRVVSTSLINLKPDIEEAAISLGASRLTAFRLVVLPNIRGGVAAAAVLAFITSFDQVAVSLFLTGPGVSTLPISMLTFMEYNYDPTIAALSTLLIIFSIGLVLVFERVLGLSRYV
ncbi:ABC transporter permease [Deinococcus marmoris]|uniref:Spermidine Putrescine ABC transporter permease component potC n=1 Tax=Deinococcus marmoris TaxID=249408 RepID=A0A1U7NVJ3_9DEIO|nr:ABC transporter permease [Deinococcus marmoris]OLV16948.1 Spermidine Putrescine ABC transporter permease component potC [Deinococcus marmoris]